MKNLISFFAFVLFVLCMNTNSFAQDVSAPKENDLSNYQNPNLDGVGLSTVLPGNFSTSANGRAPQGTRRFINTKYIILSSEMIGSGFAGQVTSVGWRWNVPIPPAATGPIAQNVATTGTLRVYLKDTVADATTLGSARIDTNGVGYTKIIDGTISIPDGLAEINIDVPVGGPGTSPFTPTSGGAVLLIFVYKTTDPTLATPSSGAPNVCCINSPVNSLTTFQSNTTNSQAGTFSAFRPETRFGFTQLSCDLGVFNLNPVGTIAPGCTSLTVAPKAKIFNNGLLDQTSVSVQYQVPSAGYDQTVSGLSVTSGGNIEVDFPNSLLIDPTSPGIKNVTITANGTCDGNPVSYVLNTSYEVSSANPNFGGPVFGYYWSNSTSGASCAPDQPIFFWEDTTGSTSLILDNVNQAPGIFNGSLDDGHFSLGGVLGANVFRYGGVAYDSFYIGTNGFVAFTKVNNTNAQFNTSVPIAISSLTAPRPALFALWKDFNYADLDVPINRLSYKVTSTKFIITYDRAPNFGVTAGSDDYVSFQVILELSPLDAGITDNLIIVQYDDATTGSVFLTKYNTLALAAHTAGIQDATGTSAIQYRRAVLTTVTAPGPLFSSPVAVSYGPSNTVLPVELASFTSSVNKSDVTLNWSTATELNNLGFDIERSVNENWTKVGNVSGNGTTTSPQNYSYTDRNLASGSYSYRLKQIDFNGNFEYFNLSSDVSVGIPAKFDLSQNYPNPFNPSTNINFDLPYDSKVIIKLFDLSGREVATLVNEVKTAGYYSVNFNASSLSSGVYFYTISADNFTATKKMMLLK